MTDASPTIPAAPPKRRRRFRWYTRLALVLAGVVVATVVIAQVLFWTDIPRQIVQHQIGNILHVDAKLGSLKIGWLGHVRVRGLVLQLPTEREPFLSVDEANLKLAALPLLIIDQEVHDLAARGVALDLRQLPDGRWNLEQLIASAAGPSPEPKQPTDPAKVLANLPSVRLTETRVTITQLDGKRLELPDVGATLDRTAPLTTAFAAHVGKQLNVSGQVATLGTAPHSATVTLTSPPPGLAEFLGQKELPSPIRATLTWTGRLTRDGLTGALSFDDVQASLLHVAGRAGVNADSDGSIYVRPIGLTLTADADAPATPPTTGAVAQAFLPVFDGALAQAKSSGGVPPDTGRNAGAAVAVPTAQPAGPIVLSLEAGRFGIAGGLVRVERLRGTVNRTGKIAVDGTLDPVTFAGDLAAAWEDVVQAGIATTGHVDARSTKLFTGKLRIDVGAGASVRLPTGEAVATLVVDGEGSSPTTFEANLNVQPIAWTPTGKPAVVAPALTGTVSARGDVVELNSLRNVEPTLGSLLARGRVTLSTLNWWATLDATQLKLPPLESMGVKGPIDASVNAWGDKAVYVVQHLYGRLGAASVWATGAYRKTEPKPLRLDTWAWYGHADTGDAQVAGLTAQGVIGGTLGGPIEQGARDLEAALDVHADDLVVAGRTIGDVNVRVDASITNERIGVASREMELLGGAFALNAWRDQTSPDAPFVATLDFKKIPVARLGELVGQKSLTGTIDEGHVDVSVPASLKLDDVSVTATARGTRLAALPLQAETLTFVAALKDGEFRAAPVLREGDGRLDAELIADVRGPIENGGATAPDRPVRVAFTLADWPAPVAATTQPTTEPAATQAIVRSRASAKGDLTVAIRPDQKIDAIVTMNAGVDRGAERLAEISIDAAANDRVLSLKKAIVNTLDGTMHATGSVDVTNVNGARLDATFDRLAPATLGWIDPLIGEVRGRFDGSLTIAPATEPRPLGPMQITLAVRPTPDAGFRSVALGTVDARAFADFEGPQKFRVVTDRAVIHVADGEVKPFGRFSYDAAVGPSQLVTVKFERLDIDQLTRVAIDDGKPIVGRLAGTLRVFGPARSLDTLNGEAVVKITESDLANFGPVAALYNIMNVGTAGGDAKGEGDVSARIEGGTLTLTDATYFNRGVFANAFGTVKDVGKLADAQLDLTLIGSLQPLRQSGNGFISQVFGDVNDTMAALQTSVSAISAKGTLKKPQVGQVGLNELGSGLQSLLAGKTK